MKQAPIKEDACKNIGFFHFELFTSIPIQASAEEVWQVLTEFEAYPEWNPFLKKVSGEKAVGKKWEINIDGMTFKPTVLKYEKNKELEWIGKLLFSGLFDGQHRFYLQKNADGSCLLIHSEKFKGLLIPLLGQKSRQKFLKGFQAMNKALKERVEQS